MTGGAFTPESREFLEQIAADDPHQAVLDRRAARRDRRADGRAGRRAELMKREAWFELARDLDWDALLRQRGGGLPARGERRALAARRGVARLGGAVQDDLRRVRRQPEREGARGGRGARARSGASRDFKRLPRTWLNGLKLHDATLPLAEFAAVIGNLRAARFGRTAAWRTAASFGALDELRHTQIPLLLMHDAGRAGTRSSTGRTSSSTPTTGSRSPRATWPTSSCWAPNPIEFAIGDQLRVRDRLHQPAVRRAVGGGARGGRPAVRDDARRASRATRRATRRSAGRCWPRWSSTDKQLRAAPGRQVVLAQLAAVRRRDRLRDGLPDAARRAARRRSRSSCRSGSSTSSCTRCASTGSSAPGTGRPSSSALDHYHHMVYASAYTYRASVWFDSGGARPRGAGLAAQQVPGSPGRRSSRCGSRSPRAGAPPIPATTSPCTAPPSSASASCASWCCAAARRRTNSRRSSPSVGGRKRIFCSEPCRWIFESEPERYAAHAGIVQRVLAGEAPANLLALLRQNFGLDYDSWGKDAFGGDYPWLERERP